MTYPDKWLEAQANAHFDANDNEALDADVAEMLKLPEHDVTDISNIAEAISQANANDQDMIRDYIVNKEWAKLGLKISVMSYDYQVKIATLLIQP